VLNKLLILKTIAMAKFKLNKMVEGASGGVGQNMMFRQVGRTTLFTSKPEFKGVSTEKQRNHRERFKRAANFAKEALKDPATKAAYAEKTEGKDFLTAFAMAVKDFLKSPKVDSIDNSGYSGKVGESIILKVSDDFKVADVKVTISLANATVVETGTAVMVAGTADWKFVTTKANATLAGSKIKVVVTDKPGNTTSFEKTL
jgi:hypothetical protein